jgi:hypothetical protein
MGSSRRRVLNQSTHARVANSTASNERHGLRRWITSVLNRPMIVSARALSYASPTLPTVGSIPASARRSVSRMLTYCDPRTPFCVSSRDSGLVDRLPPPGDEREHLTGDVALQATDRFQLGVAFCDAAGHIRLGPLIGS